MFGVGTASTTKAASRFLDKPFVQEPKSDQYTNLMENSQSKFGTKTMNMINKKKLGSGPTYVQPELFEENDAQFNLLGHV